MKNMKLTAEDARNVVWGESIGWEIVEDRIVDHKRWSVCHRAVCCNKKTGKYYRFDYSVGATENQEQLPYEWDEEPVVVPEVLPVTKKIVCYELPAVLSPPKALDKYTEEEDAES